MPFAHIDKGPGDLIRSADWNEMGREIQRLGGDKVDRAGDTVGPLSIRGDATVGTPNAGAALRVYKRQEDGAGADHGALVLGTDSATAASLRLGYAGGYSWLQGQGRQALALNPRGGDVGVGTDAPRSRLSVAGGLAVGAAYASSTAAPAGTLLVEGSVGIGTTAPRSALDTGLGVMTGAASDYLKGQFTMSGGGSVTWGGPGGRLKWTARFIAIPMGRPAVPGGFINIFMPTTDIPGAQVHNGAARSATADGVVLHAWEALYAVHAPGGNEVAITYRIVQPAAEFNAPSNWLLVAAVNGDDGTVRLGTGEIVGRGNTLQRRLDVAETGAATVRATDFFFGHSARRGAPGRAIVDATRQLVVNYGGDWADGVQVQSALSVTGALTATGAMAANGGLSVAGALNFGSQVRQMVNLWGTQYAIGVQASTAYFRTDSNLAFYRGGVHSDAALDPGAGGSALMALRLNGNVGIGTTEPRARLEVAGAIMPAAGNAEAAGILFPPNPGGGGGDSAWMRYYARTGEATTLEIGVANDTDDHIALMPSGGVGVGTREPRKTLHVHGSEFHSSGPGAGLSFQNRESAFIETPWSGERWVWYSTGGIARLWSGVDRMSLGIDGVINAGGMKWGNGSMLQADQGGSLELGGNNGVAGTGWPYIDFHFANGRVEDFNVRIMNDGDGHLSFHAPVVTAHCFDFWMGHRDRRGSPGRALVDDTSTLVLNYGGDWRSGVRHFGTFGQVSTRKIKEDIVPLETAEAAEILEGLDPVRYRLIADEEKEPHLGFIAEEVPDAIATADRGAIVSSHIVAVLTRVVKDQQRRLADLTRRLDAAGMTA
ncbi:MAG TPA: tail fiber domain-containing protein [Longimicrobium sp.]|nr:tail fiber domain-containing protein [Longimicrobium sp.]